MKQLDLFHDLGGAVRKQFLVITPEMARNWLEHRNIKNRPLNSLRVDHWIHILESGQYVTSADDIAFDVEGRLVNGQHRLTAVAESGISIEQFVMFNADPRMFKITDQQLKRTTAQMLQLDGIKAASVTAAIAGNVIRFRNGEMFLTTIVSTPDVSKFVVENPIIEECGMHSKRLCSGPKKLNFQPSSVGFALFLANEAGWMDEVLSFLERVKEGANLQSGSSELALRRRSERKESTHKGKYLSAEQTAIIIKAFNYHIKCRRIEVISWSEVENFPSFIPIAFKNK